ncbi:TRAP transporter small permease subunit [Oceanomicrobium pacificus]|uniref:TRAP transporter small permease protein n=1 Tax=Oceanomicrobium pacificus TaxID=2692916 RepID=A0A6B0TNJ7_9RHOB|nr:TRAP transporter small permease subunit [Oceanomicrobium pacificus]MXU66180.1 C4-dicarboxylate ABC transporter permease [Oceanomicrobium pacificus]
MLDGVIWFFTNLLMGFVNFFKAILNPMAWLDWSDKEALGRFIYYGGSVEFFFVVVDLVIVLTIAGLLYRPFMWGMVRVMEGFSNSIGRFFAWAGLFMVLQQIIIVFLQRIFRVADITVGPFGYVFTRDLSWYSEELKLYNAMIVALCCAYTFVQGGHVRVDLFYAGMRFRTKRLVDMLGSLFFVLPMMTLVWLYGWYFMWRHLVTPKISATDKIEVVMRKTKLMKWNVETIGFSPNGFDAYFLFKVLLVAFAGMMFIQGLAFFYRSLLERIEGEESAGKYLDKDKLDDEISELVESIH